VKINKENNYRLNNRSNPKIITTKMPMIETRAAIAGLELPFSFGTPW